MDKQPSKGQESAGTLRDFLTVLFKHKYKILTVFFVIVCSVILGTFLLPPTYEAKSSLLVKFGREYIYRPEVGDKSPVIAVNHEEIVNSEISIITSRDLIEKVITSLTIQNIYPDLIKSPPSKTTPMEAAVIIFQKKLRVEGVKKANIIEVAFQHEDPRIAAKAVNLLIDFYKVKHLQVYSGQESSFLDEQLVAYDKKLKESENNLESFKQNNQVFSLNEQRSLQLQQRMVLDTTLKQTRSNIDELQKRLSSLKYQMNAIAENKDRYTQTEMDKIIIESKAKLLLLQLNEQDLLKKYKEGNRLVQNNRKEIQLVKEFLKEQETDIGNKVKTGNVVYQDVEKETIKAEVDLHSQIAKEKTLRQQLNQLDADIKALDLKENGLQNAKREVATNEKNYLAYVGKVEDGRISDNMNQQKMANFSIVQAAIPPAKPIKPKKAMNIALGVILGAVSGLGFAFFSEYAAQSFSNKECVEKRLGVRVLATVRMKE